MNIFKAEYKDINFFREKFYRLRSQKNAYSRIGGIECGSFILLELVTNKSRHSVEFLNLIILQKL